MANTLEYFKIYKETLQDSLNKIKRISFKKMQVIKELIETVEIFLSKEVHGRIVPGNYLLLFVLLLGTKNHKLIEIGIRTIYKLFSFNFIHENEELSLGLLREEFREFLLVDVSILKSRTFKEIYLETLMGVQEKDEGIVLLIAKNISLVVRMFQHALNSQSILSVQEYLANELVAVSGKGLAIEKPLKSTLVQILRHVLENLRELDYNVLLEGEGYTLQTVCKNSLTLMVDQVVMREAVQEKYPQVTDYKMIPAENFKEFKIYRVSTQNENNQINGKFGWCIRCRKPADYYCKSTRVPVCSFECKNKYTQESHQFEKCLADETRAQQIFIVHARQVVLSLGRDLLHQDMKRRVITTDIVNLIFAEPRRFKSSKDHLKKELSLLFKNSLLNVVAETEAYSGCLVIIMKKLLYMDSFVDEIELLIEMVCRKVENIQMNADCKAQLLKYVKQMVPSEVVSDIFLNLDCELKRKNSLERLVRSIVNVYSGIKVPEVVFEEEARIKGFAIETINELIKYLKELNKKPQKVNKFHITSLTKDEKAKLNEGIELFNTEAKPQKGLKFLFKEGILKQIPQEVALFLMKNLDVLRPTQVGECLGSHDEFLIKCLDSFIALISFERMDIDEGMRHLLDHFTLPSESQQVSRIIESFGNKFYQDNRAEGVFASSSAVYSFSYLLMMLQSNLHNPQVTDKMKFADYQKLAKGMNEGNDFPLAYLQHLYNSIQKNQLGFHEKQKEKDFAAAYQQGGRKLAEIYQKETEKLAKRVESQFSTFKYVTDFRPRVNCVRELWTALSNSVIQAITLRFRTLEDKESQSKLIILSIDNDLTTPQEKMLLSLFSQINFDAIGPKQSLIIESIMEWSTKYTNHMGAGWRVVFAIISAFQKRKCIVKVKEPRSKVLVVLGDRLCLQEAFVQTIFAKSPEYETSTIISMLNGLIQTSREELKDEQQIFSLQRILDLVECNMATITDIFKLVWPPLRDYYVELGLSPNEKIALFGVDFLKQFILKLMRKREAAVFQKDFFVLYETIFTSCELEGVKEFILGSISSLSSHNASQFKEAWKPILAVYISSFEGKHSDQIKTKTFQALNKLIETSLPYVEEFLFDLIHILGRLSKQKEEAYIRGSLRMIEEVMQYYNRKQVISPDNPNSADIEFLQKTLLPLLNIVAALCGDHRSDLQGDSMNVLFSLLMTYGTLFSYEFWKMVFQGVIRPTFDEILYTYQTRFSEPRREVTEWLKASFSKLFGLISELVNKYYSSFRLFLPDIFKIYENCIQNSNQLLTKLSINAVNSLVEKVGCMFVEEDWDHFLDFLDALFKKTIPLELSSVQSWRAARQEQQGPHSETYTTKCLSQLLLLDVADNVLERFSVHLSDDHLQKLKLMVAESYEFTRNFNAQFELRNSLWQEGFLSDMKQLPGLLKQERESLKCLVLLQFYRYQLAEQKHEHAEQRFQEYISLILDTLNLYLQKQRLLLVPNSNEVGKQETERVALNMRILVRDTIIPQLEETDVKLLKPHKKQFFQILLEMLRFSTTMKRPCLGCKRCDKCAENYPVEMEFDEAINKLITALFELE